MRAARKLSDQWAADAPSLLGEQYLRAVAEGRDLRLLDRVRPQMLDLLTQLGG